MNLGDKIKKLRKEQNLSQEQLAEKLNISRQAVSKWEAGKAYPDIENLKVLKGIFNISIDELVMDEDLTEIQDTNGENTNETNIEKEKINNEEEFEPKSKMGFDDEEEDDLPTKLMFVGFMIGMGIGFITDNYIWGTAACFIGLGVGELIECVNKKRTR